VSEPASSPVRPLREDEFPSFLDAVMSGYASDMIEAGVEPEVARAKAEHDQSTLLGDGPATDGHLFYAIVSAGDRVGYLWLADRDGDLGRSLFVYAINVDEAARGRGLGRAAMVFAEEEARRRGIPKVSLNVFGENDAARGLYRSLGYREVAVAMEKRV
jgi:ribosomal protein S18 acetylase RimI-like enzyme